MQWRHCGAARVTAFWLVTVVGYRFAALSAGVNVRRARNYSLVRGRAAAVRRQFAPWVWSQQSSRLCHVSSAPALHLQCRVRAVGEPINKEAWEWYYHVVGGQRCDIIDTWWQTGVCEWMWGELEVNCTCQYVLQSIQLTRDRSSVHWRAQRRAACSSRRGRQRRTSPSSRRCPCAPSTASSPHSSSPTRYTVQAYTHYHYYTYYLLVLQYLYSPSPHCTSFSLNTLYCTELISCPWIELYRILILILKGYVLHSNLELLPLCVLRTHIASALHVLMFECECEYCVLLCVCDPCNHKCNYIYTCCSNLVALKLTFSWSLWIIALLIIWLSSSLILNSFLFPNFYWQWKFIWFDRNLLKNFFLFRAALVSKIVLWIFFCAAFLKI